MNNKQSKAPPARPNHPVSTSNPDTTAAEATSKPVELGGPKGPEPTRYGDWEKAGRCSDF